MFQATSNTSSLNAVPTILESIVPVKLRIAFYALPYCSKKETLVSKYLSPGFFRGMERFSRFCIIIPQINQLLKIFTSTYYFIDFLEPAKD